MTDAQSFSETLEKVQCANNHRCGVADICMCSFAEDLIAALSASEARVKELEGALIHIEEYWNGSRTDGAMSDALDEILETARAALGEKESQRITEEGK